MHQAVCCRSPLPATAFTCHGATKCIDPGKGCCSGPHLKLQHYVSNHFISLFTKVKGSTKWQSLPKIPSTHGCSSPRKSLVKGERLMRYEKKPEWVLASLKSSKDECCPSHYCHGTLHLMWSFTKVLGHIRYPARADTISSSLQSMD